MQAEVVEPAAMREALRAEAAQLAERLGDWRKPLALARGTGDTRRARRK